jgi:uncharacterized membrane protein YhaH (DUF805 family)
VVRHPQPAGAIIRMHWNDLITVCWALPALMSLKARRWIDASWAACFAVFMVLDRMFPATMPGQVKYVFLIIGVLLIVCQVGKKYRQYKKSLLAR